MGEHERNIFDGDTVELCIFVQGAFYGVTEEHDGPLSQLSHTSHNSATTQFKKKRIVTSSRF